MSSETEKPFDGEAVAKMLAALIAVDDSDKRLNTLALVSKFVIEGRLPFPKKDEPKRSNPTKGK